MKEVVKNILRKIRLYHPLQRWYRSALEAIFRWTCRRKYRKWKGQGYECNFCGARYERFVPEYPTENQRPAIKQHHVIAGFGENVYCPACLSKNRERLLKAFISDTLNIKGKTILHFSPEKHLHRFLRSLASVRSADLTPGFYRQVDPHVVAADATQLPFDNDSFDVLIANHVLEHIPQDQHAMGEFFRVLKPGGWAILQVPFSRTLPSTLEDPYINNAAEQEKRFGQKDHVRIYAYHDYMARLGNAGFSVTVVSADSLSRFQRYAIQQEECIFLCTKSVAKS